MGPTVPLVGAPWFALSERNSPGSIIVNMAGQRFMNESMPYVEGCHHVTAGSGAKAPARANMPWLVFDQQYRDRYIFAGLKPGQRHSEEVAGFGVIVTALTLAELAEKAGLPADELGATVDRFNGFARCGVDEDFHRGESAYDRYYGDPTNKPIRISARSAIPLTIGKMVPGDLGTKGGIRTDVHAGFGVRRQRHCRPVCGRERQRPGDGSYLSRSGRHDRPGDAVRIPCSAAHYLCRREVPIDASVVDLR